MSQNKSEACAIGGEKKKKLSVTKKWRAKKNAESECSMKEK